MQQQFIAIHNPKTSNLSNFIKVVQVQKKAKKSRKRSASQTQKDKKRQLLLKDQNEDEQDDNILEWSKNNIGFLMGQQAWGNHLQGSEWFQQQKKLQSPKYIQNKNEKIQGDQKMTKIQINKYSPFLQKNQQSGLFSDSQFQPNEDSITGQWGPLQKYKQVKWNRASKVLQDYIIFRKKISPRDIIQGKLGDCYFLAAVASLAERPDRIFKLFLTKEVNKKKYFAVKLLYKGKWKVIDLDQHFPFLGLKPAFSKASDGQIWVMLLEKAWAKLYKSYMNIASGHAQEVLHDFTGAPIKFYKLKDPNLDKQELWKYLLKASKRQYSMCASSNAGSDQKMSQTGIVQGHAYTLLNATTIKYEKQVVRLLQLRNPWGRKQNKGDWGDKDTKWNKISQQEKQRIFFNSNLKDGIFFIEFQDFLRQYRSVVVSQINDDASYVYESAKDFKSKGVYFKVTIRQKGMYSFQVDKTPKRSLTMKQQSLFKYPYAHVKIFSPSQDYKEVHNFRDNERLTSRRYTMQKGIYICFVLIEFSKEYQKQYEVTLAMYSQHPCEIQIASKTQSQKIASFQIKLKGSKSRSKSKGKKLQQEEEQIVLKGGIKFNYISPKPEPSNKNIQQTNHASVQMKNKNQYLNVAGRGIYIPEGQNNEPRQSQENWINQRTKAHVFDTFNLVQLDVQQYIDKQIILIQPSPAQQFLISLRKSKQIFVDQRFPPNLNSLSGQWGQIQRWSKIRWQKLSNVMPKGRIFQGKIKAQSIRQGFLGDCYFLASLAALAQKPDRILNLFLLHQNNEYGYFSVKIIYKGKWLKIDMDDYIPYNYDIPAFSYSLQGQIWVMLLQKAWAKIYTSYKKIQAGFPQEALHDLTGAPIKHIYLQRTSFDIQKEWLYLLNASKLQYSMVASSQNGADSQKSVTGIVQGHAYTLLKVLELKVNNQIVRLVQLRNPWGKGQSSGLWSDLDHNWDLISEQKKNEIGFSKSNDGIFFMDYYEFCKEFKLITIAQINDNASYLYKSIKDYNSQGCYFKVQILLKGNYSFQVDSTPERTFQFKFYSNYRYPKIIFRLAERKTQAYMRQITTTQSNGRTSFYQSMLDIGTYFCFVQILFDTTFDKECDVNLAIYGDYACKIDFASKQEAIKFSNNPNVNWPFQMQKNNVPTQWNALRSYKP